MAGNRLGDRRYFAYTTDAGNQYSILFDVDLAQAGGLVLDDAQPFPPARFEPRGVYAEADDGARRFIPCGPASALYASNLSQSVTIDDEDFTTTGRRGESISFPRNRPLT